MNIILVDGFYDAQDRRLIDGVQDDIFYAKRRGEGNLPFPNAYILTQWELNDDYEDFVAWVARRIAYERGNTVIVTPNRDQSFDCPIATVQLKHPARLAQLFRLGVNVVL